MATQSSTSTLADETDVSASSRPEGRQAALRRFALAITVLTIVGHGYLGFEQSVAQPLIALATAYSMQLLLEWLYARTNGLTPGFYGGIGKAVDFLLPAHIAALAVAMLLYYNDRVWIVAFATSVAIGSKFVLRVPTASGSRHFFNPSNLGLSVTFLLFPSVGITMPWQWTTEISGAADWLFPVVIFVLGTILHLKHAGRIWVVVSFLVAFVVQAVLRGLSPDVNLLTTLAPATGVPAAIFTFYMAPDPATSPAGRNAQILFGSGIALSYMILMYFHVVFALFYALAIVCLARGLVLAATTLVASRRDRSRQPKESFASRTA
jgi:hypothetical protein